MANLKWLLIGVLVLLGLYFLIRSQQSGYATQTDRVFPENVDEISKITFEKNGKSLSLVRQDTAWVIEGHDSLRVRQNRMDMLLNQTFEVKRETVMTQKSENWPKYSVDDSAGSHIRVYGSADKELVHAVFGRSTSDWSRNYVRVGEGSEVFLTDLGVVNQVNTTPTYWGEKPPEPEPAEADSLE